jgi:hypothetical protein
MDRRLCRPAACAWRDGRAGGPGDRGANSCGQRHGGGYRDSHCDGQGRSDGYSLCNGYSRQYGYAYHRPSRNGDTGTHGDPGTRYSDTDHGACCRDGDGDPNCHADAAPPHGNASSGRTRPR